MGEHRERIGGTPSVRQAKLGTRVKGLMPLFFSPFYENYATQNIQIILYQKLKSSHLPPSYSSKTGPLISDNFNSRKVISNPK
jgi:hypothetical protein